MEESISVIDPQPLFLVPHFRFRFLNNAVIKRATVSLFFRTNNWTEQRGPPLRNIFRWMSFRFLIISSPGRVFVGFSSNVTYSLPLVIVLVWAEIFDQHYLTIRLQARVFYEQIVNEAQPSWLSLVENEGE